MRGPRAESSPARKRAALSAAGFWHRRRSKKSAVRNLRPDMEAAGGEKVPATPHPLNHGALRLPGPATPQTASSSPARGADPIASVKEPIERNPKKSAYWTPERRQEARKKNLAYRARVAAARAASADTEAIKSVGAGVGGDDVRRTHHSRDRRAPRSNLDPVPGGTADDGRGITTVDAE